MLDIKDLNAFYGKSHILRGVNLNIEKGEIVSLLGRNGVGRSTLVKAIMGLVQPQGSIKFLGEEISGMPSHTIALKGIGYVPENRDIFPTLTVKEIQHGNIDPDTLFSNHPGTLELPNLSEYENHSGSPLHSASEQKLGHHGISSWSLVHEFPVDQIKLWEWFSMIYSLKPYQAVAKMQKILAEKS